MMNRRQFITGAAGLVGASRLRAQSVNLHHVMCPGHSLMYGTSGGASISTTQPFANKILAGGTSLSPLVAVNSAEDPTCGLANQLRSMGGAGYDVVVTRNAHPSANYNGMKKGGTQTYYADSVTNAQLLPGAASAAGLSYAYSAIAVILGENDFALFNGANYALNMRQFQRDYSTDLNSGRVIPMFVHQFYSWNGGTHASTTPITDFDATPNVCLGQWYSMRDNPGSIFLVAPLYGLGWGKYSDNVHLTNAGYRIFGEMFGKWMKYVLVDGATWAGLPPRRIQLSGNVITCQFWLRPGRSLVIDTTTVSDKGAGKGFEVWDATLGSSLTVSSVSVSGDTATITLSGTPTAGNSIRLRSAYSATLDAQGGTSGTAHSNIRNDDPTVGQGSGANLYDWAITFDESVPFAWNPPQTATRYGLSI